MGTILAYPDRRKESYAKNNKYISYGMSVMQGYRIYMEDRCKAVLNLKAPFDKWSFFGIFDGHSGSLGADMCQKLLLDFILDTSEMKYLRVDSNGDPCNVSQLWLGIRRGFKLFDESIRTHPDILDGTDDSGSTATCVFITPRYFIFVNCGDSRTILIRNNDCIFATQDHKPTDPLEADRIQNAGGNVEMGRVEGCLAVSRGLGDFYFKSNASLPSTQQMVSSDPKVTFIPRILLEDQVIVLASDGIWDAISNEDMCNFVCHRIQRVSCLKQISREIIETAFRKGSQDNMAVILVYLLGPKVVVDDTLALAEARLTMTIKKAVKEYKMKCDIDKDNYDHLSDYLYSLNLLNLPPGGIMSRWDVIEEYYNHLNEEDYVRTPRTIRLRNSMTSESKTEQSSSI